MSEHFIMKVELSEEAEDKLAERIAEKIIAKSKDKTASNHTKEKKLYKVSDIASVTGQAPSTITRHIEQGLLQAKKIGQPWFIDEENYNNYINIKPPKND